MISDIFPVSRLTPCLECKRGRKIYEPPRYMSPTVALQQIISAINITYPSIASASPLAELTKTPAAVPEEKGSEPPSSLFEPLTPVPLPEPTPLIPSKTLALSLSRVGTSSQGIKAGTLEELAEVEEEEFGGPLHSLIIVGKRVHDLEIEYAGQWAVGGKGKSGWWKVAEETYGVSRGSK